MAADTGKIFACKGATKGGVEIDGVTNGRIIYNVISKRDPITKKIVVTRTDVSVEVYGNNARALTLLLGSSAEDVVLSVLRDDGSTGTETLKTVCLSESLGSAEIPEADSGGKLASFGIRGACEGNGDLASKWISA
jgi:hypothetical protein